jgi:O-antigen ligase
VKPLLFGSLFVGVCLLALAWPAVGVFAYMMDYIIAPVNYWWGEALVAYGARFSFFLAIAIAGGLVLNWSKLRQFLPGPVFHSQEWLVVLFVAIVLLSRLWGVPIDMAARDLSGVSQTPAEKMVKVAIFVLMMTHVLTRAKEMDVAYWFLVLIGGLFLGLDAYMASESRFVHGRLDQLGGADYRESSTVGAHLAFVGALAGALFLKSRAWWKKVICVVAGMFTINALILTQTRAAMLGLLAAAFAAPFLAMRGQRLRICLYLLLGLGGAYALTNNAFWERAETISSRIEDLDRSAASRIDLWEAGLMMARDHPFGVGAGSFYTVIGSYDAAYAGRDCHNTYIRCVAELGIPGFLVFLAIIINAFRILRRVPSLAAGTPVEHSLRWDCFGLQLALIAYLTAGFFMGLTYLEEFWWFICLPVCLERAARNALAEHRVPVKLVKVQGAAA